MKRNLIASFALAVAAMAASSPAVFAESSEQATVPFSFQFGHSTMPAGTYKVETNGFGPITLRDTHNGHAKMALGISEQNYKNTNARLLFHVYGQQHYLAEIWNGGTSGVKVPETKREQETRAANNLPVQEQVILLAMK